MLTSEWSDPILKLKAIVMLFILNALYQVSVAIISLVLWHVSSPSLLTPWTCYHDLLINRLVWVLITDLFIRNRSVVSIDKAHRSVSLSVNFRRINVYTVWADLDAVLHSILHLWWKNWLWGLYLILNRSTLFKILAICILSLLIDHFIIFQLN